MEVLRPNSHSALLSLFFFRGCGHDLSMYHWMLPIWWYQMSTATLSFLLSIQTAWSERRRRTVQGNGCWMLSELATTRWLIARNAFLFPSCLLGSMNATPLLFFKRVQEVSRHEIAAKENTGWQDSTALTFHICWRTSQRPDCVFLYVIVVWDSRLGSLTRIYPRPFI